MDASVISRFSNEEKKILDKSAIKDFATSARRKLIEGVSQKAYLIGISKEHIKEVDIIGDGVRIDINNETVYLTNKENEQRNKLIEQIEQKGYEQVMEEVAYTWFNRIIAIRFMEVNNYLPIEIRILSSEDGDKMEPDAVSQVNSIVDELNLKLDKVYKFQDDNDVNGLFKYIFVKQCNALGKIMPVMFEKIEDYTELLLPDGLLLEGNVINDLVNNIDEEDFKNQVEIIGWMYQYYISEKKDKVFADLKKNKKITKENIPAATQLFTPDWIVRYMVENSLGRLWLEGHPDEELQESFKYYLEEAKQEPEVEKELEKIRKESSKLSPEDITVLDPAMGSGHILVYAFDLLYQIYVSAGYSERDIPRLILEKNLYGLDIDDRAGQLAYFALIMKARSYSRRLFRDMERNPIELNICAIQDSNDLTKEDIAYFSNGDEKLQREIEHLISLFIDAKEYGFIVNVEEIDIRKIEYRLIQIQNNKADLSNIGIVEHIIRKIPRLIKQYINMINRYNFIITNPPYMGSKSMDFKLSKFTKENYERSKYDIYTVFMDKALNMLYDNGYLSMITMESWMFLSSFEELRKRIIDNTSIISLINMPYEGRGKTSLGINFGTSAFVIKNRKNKSYKGNYMCIRYNEINDEGIPIKFPTLNKKYANCKSSELKNIPGSPIIYWFSNNTLDLFRSHKKISEFINPRIGLISGDNNRFLRYWYEVENNKIGFGIKSIQESVQLKYKWFPYHKGGDYRKWYGNLEYVVNWQNDGYEMKYENSLSGRVRSHNYNGEFSFKKGLTWSSVTSGKFSCRYSDNGFLFDSAGPLCYIDDEEKIYIILAYLSSVVAEYFLEAMNPTINMPPGYLSSLPYIEISNEIMRKINELVELNINYSIYDWNLFEKSWDFKKHPMIEFKCNNIENSFNNLEHFTEKQFNQLKSNEEELNRIFIDIYGLQDELTPKVEDKDITIRKADRDREMKSFISYAVGCMMGRYSLDEEGLVYAGGEFDINKYKTFKADEDAIIPITDNEYFEDDIVAKFVEFVKVVFGQDSLEENLNYIADTECFKRKTNETSRECLRRYFLKGFMEDHLKVYQKRPIYWMFDSGKQNGFKALIYMHRYDENMVAKIRTDYLHRIQRTYESEIIRLEKDINSEVLSTKEKTRAKKDKEKISKQINECKAYDQVIAHVANQRISIDLDDGVKVNYNKFQGIEIPQGQGRKSLKADLLFKVKM